MFNIFFSYKYIVGIYIPTVYHQQYCEVVINRYKTSISTCVPQCHFVVCSINIANDYHLPGITINMLLKIHGICMVYTLYQTIRTLILRFSG